MAPHGQYLRGGVKMGNLEFIETMIKDGLWDTFNGYYMGNTAANVAKQSQITRAVTHPKTPPLSRRKSRHNCNFAPH
jgi:acetyl-CoA acetyltransferase